MLGRMFVDSRKDIRIDRMTAEGAERSFCNEVQGIRCSRYTYVRSFFNKQTDKFRYLVGSYAAGYTYYDMFSLQHVI